MLFINSTIHNARGYLAARGYPADDFQLVANAHVRQVRSADTRVEHSFLVGRAAILETEPLPPQDHYSGTVCRPISD